MKYILIKETDFQRARNKIKESNKGKVGREKVVFSSSDDDLNRKVLEKEHIDVLLLSLSGRKDKMKQRDSGFNHVLAKLAKKRNVVIGINLDEVAFADTNEKSGIIARIRQNIKICNKNKIKMVFISKQERNKYDLRSLGLVLGMPTWMTREL